MAAAIPGARDTVCTLAAHESWGAVAHTVGTYAVVGAVAIIGTGNLRLALDALEAGKAVA